MRRMYDAVVASNCPSDGDIYAGYVNGAWPTYSDMVRLFPNARHVGIAVTADVDAHVLDVESGDATPAQARPWVKRQLWRGAYPVVYSDHSTKPALDQALAGLEWAWWDANPTGRLQLSAGGSIATQCIWTPGYDESAVVDYWPGVDPAPSTKEDELLFYLIGDVMPIALDDQDARNATVRLLFERHLGREPSVTDQQAWANVLATKGLDYTIAGIFDSQEAQDHRKAEASA